MGKGSTLYSLRKASSGLILLCFAFAENWRSEGNGACHREFQR